MIDLTLFVERCNLNTVDSAANDAIVHFTCSTLSFHAGFIIRQWRRLVFYLLGLEKGYLNQQVQYRID